MTAGLRITEVERITLLVPFRSRVEPWLNLLNWQWGIVEITRVVTDAGYVGTAKPCPTTPGDACRTRQSNGSKARTRPSS